MLTKSARPQLLAPLLAGLLAAAVPSAFAGTAAVTNGEGETMLFEYNDAGLLRVSPDASADGYMVFRDDTLYVVVMNEGQPMVMNASSMMQGMSGLIKDAAPSAATAEVVSLEKTGRQETIAGIRGDVYELVVREDGSERTTEIVMSDDRRAMEFRDAMFSMARSAASSLGDDLKQRNSNLEGRLAELDLGVLRIGDDMTVTAIDSDTVASARFELPADPVDLQGLGAMIGAMGQQAKESEAAAGGDSGSDSGKKSGGLFSGMMNALGGKADRQADRTEDKVDNKIDKETDEAVDSAIGKAFGKLFGD